LAFFLAFRRQLLKYRDYAADGNIDMLKLYRRNGAISSAREEGERD
jgi:hypothetical protein